MAALYVLTPIAILFFAFTVIAYKYTSSSNDWIATNATVIDHWAKHTGSEPRNEIYSPRVTFKFTVNDSEFESVNFMPFGWGQPRFQGKEKALEECKKYPVGSTQTVYYNPKDPGMAALHKSPYANSKILIYIGSFLFAACIIGWIVVLYLKFKS
ncbi:MAG: DUF3592 domain-containing protein [Fibrobacterales bacterium]